MIITITGKPCSGKGTASKEFCKTYNFEYICTGDMFREYAKQFGYDNILDFQAKNEKIKEIDKLIDDKIYDIGQKRWKDNIVIDSRLAWHFVEKSFKVFIDVNPEIAGKRLFEAKRDTEQYKSLEDATEKLQERWDVENRRYMELYGVNNLNLDNYDLVVSSNNLTPTELVEKIHEEYLKFIKEQG